MSRLTNLSTADFANGGTLSFSVPFGGCVGARESDGVDLSEGAAVDSVVFFFSPAACAGTGVEGRGEGATLFCYNLESVCIALTLFRWFLTFGAPFVGAQRCSRFLRLA